MKLLSFAHDGRESWGVLDGAGVVDLGARPALETPTLAQALREDGLMGIAMNAVGLPVDHRLDSLTLLPPVPRPTTIVCADGGGAVERDGPLWTRSADTLTAPGGRLLRRRGIAPRWRPGLAAVVGSRSEHVSLAHAHEMIGGYSCFGDWATGRSSGGAVFGPWLVTPDEFLGSAHQQLTARISGRTVYSHAAEPLIERLWRLLAHASSRRVLEPGDVLAVLAPGVPFGGLRPVPGVVCEIELPSVGTLRNDVVPEALDEPALS